ncbi:3'-5' exonuclease [Shewanella aestuarii]|uniref:3'-5' exonuclease n=1 Tax=Shewanella aestuarii TaxID=1028752 RepID=A0A6G9QQF8_9GAMM|nr:3'-5' exonuclease [Shewanella aestuarii]QIR16658.1 3'-5' exonuclease [Shewanella aestuarii]
MMDEALEILRQKAIADKLAFGVTRLRSEFKMKPKPDAKVHDYVKSPYNGGKNPIYLLTECVPLRVTNASTTPPTPKQILAGKILAFKNKIKMEMSYQFYQLWTEMFDDVLIIDTETTGLNHNAQVIELGIIDAKGNVLYQQRFKPTVAIEDGAIRIHHIKDADLENEPTWKECIDEIKAITADKIIWAYNCDFDAEKMSNTCLAFDEDDFWLEQLDWYDAMVIAAQHFLDKRRMSLSQAVKMSRLKYKAAHTAIGDCQMTLDVLKHIAGMGKQLADQLSQLEEQKRNQ